MQWACTYSPGITDHYISAARYAHTMPTLHPLTMPGPQPACCTAAKSATTCDLQYVRSEQDRQRQKCPFICNCLLHNYIDRWACMNE